MAQCHKRAFVTPPPPGRFIHTDRSRTDIPGQRTKEGPAGHSRWPQRGSTRSVHLCLISDPGRWPIAPLLPGASPAWKARKGRSGSGDQEAVATSERHGSDRYSLGAGNCVKLSALHPCERLDIKHGYCPVSWVHLSHRHFPGQAKLVDIWTLERFADGYLGRCNRIGVRWSTMITKLKGLARGIRWTYLTGCS